MKNESSAAPMRQPGTIKEVPQSGSYGTPAGSSDVKAAGKVADLKSKTSDPSTGKPQNLGKMGDHTTVCGNGDCRK